MSSLSIIPLDYDIDFIIKNAGVINHYGFERKEDGIHFRYQLDDLDAVTAKIDSYKVDYLSVMLPLAVANASYIRDERVKAFTFGGMTIELDDETKTNLNGCVLGLDRNASVEGINWSLGNGQFAYMDRATVYALADAAFMHVQQCFTAHKTIVEECMAAADIDQLAAVDVPNHAAWPTA